MTTQDRRGATDQRPRSTARRAGSIVCAVLFLVTFTLGVTSIWTRMTVFDSARFADRAERILDSDAVRAQLADEITNAIVNSGPSSLASFRTVIRASLDPILETSAFRSIFRRSIDTAHDYVFTRSGNAAIINLSQALSVLSGSLQITNPSLAESLPTGSESVLIDLSEEIRSLEFWRLTERLTLGGIALLIASGVAAMATIALDADRRRSSFVLGLAISVSGLIMFTLATIAPTIVGSFANDPDNERALSSATRLFVSDYRILSAWILGFGAMLCAFATASTPRNTEVTIASTVERMKSAIVRRRATTVRGRAVQAIALMIAGIIITIERETVVPMAALAVGAVIFYVGTVQLLSIVGRNSEVTARSAIASDLKNARFNSATIRIATVSVVILAIIGVGAWLSTSSARAKSGENDQRRCNGYAQLCDKRLDEVAFLGSHNSMSTAADPGWLFYEQTKSIPAQLDYGVRALLVKTHYGIPTTVNVTGSNLVITDSVAELAVNPIDTDDQYSDAQQQQAKQLQADIKVDPKLRDIYLCHVYCEYGSTKFTTALGYIRQFLTNNPDNVIMLFIGDYVSKTDTEKALRDSKLLDRTWDYDTSAPLPTLGELIDANRNLIMLSEFSGPPPAWNTRGYGIFQDTPFTFRKDAELYAPGSPRYTGTQTVDGPVDATATAPDGTETWTKEWAGLSSCAPNRGTPASPLFQINHWITPSGAAPTVGEAKIVNAYDVLKPRVTDCMTQRGRFPTIVGVNFVEIGDALRVVDELNGVR